MTWAPRTRPRLRPETTRGPRYRGSMHPAHPTESPTRAPEPARQSHRGAGAVTNLTIMLVGAVILSAVAVLPNRHSPSAAAAPHVRSGGTVATPHATPTPVLPVSPTPGLPPAADPATPAKIVTPFWDLPNPFVLVVGGVYYLYSSETANYSLDFRHPSPELPLRVSTDLQNWSAATEALPTLPSWASWGFTWAPDVRLIGNRYVMYFTARVKDRTPATQCIGTATAATPAGPFTPSQQMLVCQTDHLGSIDPRSFVDTNGSLWLHWKSDDNADVGGTSHTGLYAQRLSRDGLHLVGNATMILTADQPWEGRIVEAPQMVLANHRYWLFYSGNWFNQPAYAIGVAECAGPAGPCSKPASGPFLGSNAQGAGPGESSLFSDARGLWMVYGPWAVRYRTDTERPVALVHIAFKPSGPYLAAF
jgi:beta-xylosidase